MSAQGNTATRGKLRTRRLVSFRSALIVFGIVGWAMALSVGSSFGDGDNNPGTFDPTVTFETSTTRATAHPDARITIDNSGNTADVGAISISLPDGFWGSLASINSKCQNFVAGSGSNGSDDCVAGDSKVGTVKATATIDQSEATLTGDVYIVESTNSDVAAYLGIKVHAKVGGVDMGYVRVLGSAAIRGNAIGMDTVFENLPNSITQTVGPNSRTVDFHLEKMTVDLKSDLDGPNEPLLTNPSKCGSSDFIATLGSGATLGGLDDVTITQPYTVDGCEDAKFAPSNFAFTATDPNASQTTGFTATIDMPGDSASMSGITVKLPAAFGLNFPSFGDSTDMCDDAAAPDGDSIFDPSYCPAQAKIGFVTLSTPLLNGDVTGDVYLINKTPNPWIGIDVNPNIGGNPVGVTLRLLGITSVPQRDLSCSVPPCQANVRVDFVNVPDAPVSSVYMEANGPTRTGNFGPLSGETLTIASNSVCQPNDEALADFTSHSAVDDTEGAAKQKYAKTSTVALTGCDADPVVVSGSMIGSDTTDTTPTFTIAPGTSPGPGFFCAIDNYNGSFPGTACTTSYTRATAVSAGTHRVYAGTTSGSPSNTNSVTRGFGVNPVIATPGAAPATSYDGTPPTTTGPEPTFDFTADQDSHFQCSLDGGAFLPCGSVGTPSQTGSYTVTTDNALLAGSTHTFAVRAQNQEGTVDLTPVEFTFDVTVAFAPTFDVISTTTQARAHPDLDVTIENNSEEKLSATTIKLPDGFLGGLQGVQSVCPVATANAGNCPASSKVGTIETEATVDDSETIVRIGGDVFLTEKTGSDVAGLSIKVDAQIQEIDLGSIIVPARLIVRGQVDGIDSMVVDIPESITPSNAFGDTQTFFNLRKMTLKLRTGAGAAQPLLTNGSACETSNFSAEFTGNGSPSPSTSGPELIPYTVTGCDLLGFSPALSASIVRTADGLPVDSREFQPINLSANLAASPDQAGIKAASILLPKPITIDILKLPIGLCEEAQYLTNSCPASTIIGNAVATSPLLLPGEFLSGNIYLLKAVPPRVIPRLFIRLEGRIGISLVAVNSFENGTQIRAEFTDLPDAPLSSFSMNVNNFLLSQKDPCQDAETFGSAMTGTLTGHNGKTSAVNSELAFNCSGIYLKHRFKKGKKPTLTMDVDARKMQTLKAGRLQFGKYLTINKKRIKKGLILRANGKRLSAKCVRVRSKSVLDLNLCKKRYAKLNLSFKKGTLVGARKLRKPTVKLTLTDGTNKRYKGTVNVTRPQTQFKLWQAAK